MATITPEDAKNQAAEFAAAFNEEPIAKKPQTEDEVFGIASSKEPESDRAESESESAGKENPTMAIVIAPQAEQATNEAAVSEGGSISEVEPVDHKDAQRQKSWEGRLNAREKELKAREEALEDALAEMDKAKAAPKEPQALEEQVEKVAESLESGVMSPDEALRVMRDDFGDDFANMLSVIIDSKAGEIAKKAAQDEVSAVKSDIDSVRGEMFEDKKRNHFESIAGAHPDFMEVAESQEFKDWVDALPQAGKDDAMQVIESGSARKINQLLSAFKAQKEKKAQRETASDAEKNAKASDAEGVRSKGLKLPSKPSQSQDYESAWKDL